MLQRGKEQPAQTNAQHEYERDEIRSPEAYPILAEGGDQETAGNRGQTDHAGDIEHLCADITELVVAIGCVVDHHC